MYRPPEVQPRGSSDDCYEARSERRIADTLAQVVQSYGPIDRDQAYRVVAAAWGLSTLGSKIRAILDGALRAIPKDRRPQEADGALFPPDRDPATYRGVRVPDDGALGRDRQRPLRAPVGLPPQRRGPTEATVLGGRPRAPVRDGRRPPGPRLTARSGEDVTGRTRTLSQRIYYNIYICMAERAKIFQNGGSQAVRLPKSFRFPDDQDEVIVRREGRRVVLEPVDAWSLEFLDCLGQWDEEIERPDSGELESLRDPFSTQ